MCGMFARRPAQRRVPTRGMRGDEGIDMTKRAAVEDRDDDIVSNDDITPDDDNDDDDDDEIVALNDDDKPTFSQTQVNRFLAKDRKKNQHTIERDIETRLGMPISDAVDALEKLASGEKPEAQAALERRARELDEREAKLRERELELRIRERLQSAGVPVERLRRTVKLVELDDDDPDDDDITTAVDELKAEMPELFAAMPAKKTRRTTVSDDEGYDDGVDDEPSSLRVSSVEPVKPPRRRRPREDAYQLGAERAKSFVPSTF